MSESEVRALRAEIYGECTDKNWEGCKENWMIPDSIQWLKNNAPIHETPSNCIHQMKDEP